MKKNSTRSRGIYRIHCPNCHEPAIVRSSIYATEEIRQLTVECSNEACGFACSAIAEMKVTIVNTIRPSKIAREGASLRAAPLRSRTMIGGQPPVPANDVRGPEVSRFAANE